MAMNRREYLKGCSLTGAALACGLRPQSALGFEGPKGGDLQSCLEILNLWDQKPEPVVRLYSAIYNALAVDPKASFSTVAADDTVRKLCEEQGVRHLGGPMLGCLEADGAKVWLRTARPAKVEVKAVVDDEERTYGPVHSTLDSDLTAIVPVTGLKPGTVTPYRVFVDGEEIAIPKHAAISTPSDDAAQKTRITFGTCQHRWGIAHRENTDEILKQKPVAMLMYGDVAVQDRNADLGMHRADYALRDLQTTWRDLVCSTPVYTSWDDHDYFDNDRWGVPRNFTDEDRRGVRKVWTQAWNNPYYGLGDEGGGIFHHTRIGPCDVIMTDNRYFRTRNGKHCFLGPEQMAWLKKTLLSCKGPFIIMSCGTMWSDYVSGGKDSWGVFDPEGREEVFKLIEDNRIPGVLLISGDRHGARGFRIPRPSGFEFYEFEPASLGGRTGPPPTNAKWKTQLYGFSNKFAFGEFTFDVSQDDPTVTYRLVEAGGETLYELTLKRSQLTPS
ncbi:alkaline phosphatase [Haloferula helveola]|uniref:Alkaline phosphatase n=1 Tax=Haloferula helveola TaxID=490095 RepID=A0ABN6H5C7_9BACT|nr:alkaline phosphatase [Haloferula helveola]